MSSNKDYSWESIDDDFFIWLLSNDKDVIRANDRDSVRSHFIGKLPLDLDLRKGVWEMGVDKVIFNNEQSNELDYNFKDEDSNIKKSGSLSEKRYFTTFEVIEDVYEKGKDLEYDKIVVNKRLSDKLLSADFQSEAIGIIGYDEDRECYTRNGLTLKNCGTLVIMIYHPGNQCGGGYINICERMLVLSREC